MNLNTTKENKMSLWYKKAHKMIEAEAWQAYREAGNAPGKKHKPYTLPKWVTDLINAMNTNNEEKAKAIFNWQFLRDY